jgi:hypothetical protein
MLPLWLSRLGLDTDCSCSSSDCVGQNPEKMLDVLSQIVWPERQSGIEDDDVFAWSIDSRLHSLWVEQHVIRGIMQQAGSFDEDTRGIFTSPEYRPDLNALRRNIASLLAYLTSCFSPFLHDRVVVFFQMSVCDGWPGSEVSMMLPSHMQASGLLHRFPSLACVYHKGVVARGVALSVMDILANLSSKEGRQYEDACDECREVCDTFEAMHPSGPFGKRACHSGPTWITACIEPLPPAAAAAAETEGGVQKPAPRLGKVGEGFAGDALTIPVAGFSFGSDDKQGMYAARNVCHAVCQRVDNMVFEGCTTPKTRSNPSGTSIIPSSLAVSIADGDTSWAQHYRRWAYMAPRIGDENIYWACLRLADGAEDGMSASQP